MNDSQSPDPAPAAGASGVPIGSTCATISLKWKLGLNGAICCSRLSTRPCPVIVGKPGMS